MSGDTLVTGSGDEDLPNNDNRYLSLQMSIMVKPLSCEQLSVVFNFTVCSFAFCLLPHYSSQDVNGDIMMTGSGDEDLPNNDNRYLL